ncbi:MAG: phosphoribosylanthranilate isomerase [Bryobacterales bacterium]|nr:phosphoribosylanthranilate isomerase [Bryobacteraceae bacterium]MDW8353500.1 phosphoribosylanthranilate isomerase [Bryobacterales bacterium]
MIVKICGITNLEDALAAVEAGASALGFNFYPRSPRYIAPEAAGRLIQSLPGEVWKVGVFVNEPPERVAELARQAGLDVVQLHGDEPPEAVPAGLRVWKAFRVGREFDASRLASYAVEACLLDAAEPGWFGGSGRVFDWSALPRLNVRIVVAGGLDASNVGTAVRTLRPWGVDACSRLESAPGKKDRHKMAAFIQAAREAEAA